MAKYTDGGSVDLDREVVRRKDGTRMTEADARTQGDHIAARGRPVLAGTQRGARSPALNVRVSEKVRDDLQNLAVQRGVTVSALARELLEEGVNKERSAGRPRRRRSERLATD